MADSAPPVPAPWLTDAEQDAWRSFITGSRRLLEALDQDLKAQGLNHDDYGVLVALSESEGDRMRMSDLADEAVESRSRLSHHIGRLETRGLVTREACPDDRRGSWAVLTAEGRATIEALAPHHVTGVRHYFLDQMSPEDLATVGGVFAKVAANLGPGGSCLGPQCPGTGGPSADA